MTCVGIELQYQTAIIYRRLSIWNFWIISVKMSVLMNWADGVGEHQTCVILYLVCYDATRMMDLVF